MTRRKMALKRFVFLTVLEADDVVRNTDLLGLTAGLGGGSAIGDGGLIFDNAEFTLAIKSGNPDTGTAFFWT
ncbi:hypothetical protein AJ88_24130 [Mesorhizobium amorphae CCBAU 01583]|nr:hypothetical protein AJ88_24130 [Mesorhizobium amorphae CCBAU 01583]